MQQNIQQYYATNYPGQVQVVGVDEYNGTAAQLRSFRNQTGATYPLLLLGATATGGNFATLYGTFDNYVVVNKQGIVRYHAALTWPHGNRYHLNEIRGAVDSLVTQVIGVPAPPVAAGLRLTSLPNPARGSAVVELAIPEGRDTDARVSVFDLRGRRVATLRDGIAHPGVHRIAWRHEDASGAPLPPGIYLIRADVGGAPIVHRAVVLP
ncbi:MAG TPA: hypothetical protein VJY35_15820 [Candidatus Eisenbacteria bacterium]|nr:hypothetical protein [Candidatus Eisenbacteria bacterium]